MPQAALRLRNAGQICQGVARGSGFEKRQVWRKADSGEISNSPHTGEDIKDVEFSWPIGMPLVRSLGRELWEVRSSLPRGRIARVLFCVDQGSMVLLHGFIKKTQKTAQRDIALPLKRKKGVST